MGKGITLTVGLDLGDRKSQYCVLDHVTGEVMDEGKVAMVRPKMEEFLRTLGRSRLVLEAGTQSAWVTHLAEEVGHEVLVAQPSKFRAIAASNRKSDKVDARTLAMVGRVDPRLVFPVKHRGPQTQLDRATLRSRDALVRARTLLVNHCRSTSKLFGERAGSCSTSAFPKKFRDTMTAELRKLLEPMVRMIEVLSRQIRNYDREVARLCREAYPETRRLSQVPGVGALTALAFVLTVEDPRRFRRSRDVGPYLGLVPRRDQSGAVDRQLRITKAGDKLMRRLLVGCAQYILGPFGPDTDLRRWGLTYAGRGGKNAKKRAVVAVARKVAVLLHALWVSGGTYDPLRGHEPQDARTAA